VGREAEAPQRRMAERRRTSGLTTRSRSCRGGPGKSPGSYIMACMHGHTRKYTQARIRAHMHAGMKGAEGGSIRARTAGSRRRNSRLSSSSAGGGGGGGGGGQSAMTDLPGPEIPRAVTRTHWGGRGAASLGSSLFHRLSWIVSLRHPPQSREIRDGEGRERERGGRGGGRHCGCGRRHVHGRAATQSLGAGWGGVCVWTARGSSRGRGDGAWGTAATNPSPCRGNDRRRRRLRRRRRR
jgi:hypothetical protein